MAAHWTVLQLSLILLLGEHHKRAFSCQLKAPAWAGGVKQKTGTNLFELFVRKCCFDNAIFLLEIKLDCKTKCRQSLSLKNSENKPKTSIYQEINIIRLNIQ